MRKIIFFSTGIVLFCLAGWGIYKVTRLHHNVAGEEAVANLSAINLYNEFIHGESMANKSRVGKVITVKGIISSVSEAGNYISITLHATTEGGVNCSILKQDLLPDEKPGTGDSITIKGKCTGLLMDVNMVDCIIQKQKNQ